MKIFKNLKKGKQKKNIKKMQIIEQSSWKMKQAGKHCRLKAL